MILALLLGCGEASSGVAHFDGVDDHVVVSGPTALDTAQSWAIRARFRWSGRGSSMQDLVARRGPDRRDAFLLRVRTDSGGGVEVGIGDGAGECGARTHTPVPANAWTEAAASFDGASRRLTVSLGADRAEVTCTIGAATGPLPLWIGGDPAKGPTGRPFSGDIARVQVWATAGAEGTPALDVAFSDGSAALPGGVNVEFVDH